MKILIKNTRISFPHLWTPQAGADGTGAPAFSANFLLPKDDPQIKAIQEATEQVGREKFGKEWPLLFKQLQATGKLPLKDGDLKAYAGYEGCYYISARSPARPLVLNRDKTPLTEADGVIYSGCAVNASVDIWAMLNQFGKRVNVALLGVQFARDGEPFSGAPHGSMSDFEEIPAEESIDDFL